MLRNWQGQSLSETELRLSKTDKPDIPAIPGQIVQQVQFEQPIILGIYSISNMITDLMDKQTKV